MRSNDYYAQAVAAIPKWLAFLEQKEAEQDALLAQVRADETESPQKSQGASKQVISQFEWSKKATSKAASGGTSPQAQQLGAAMPSGATIAPGYQSTIPKGHAVAKEFADALAETDAHRIPLEVRDAFARRDYAPEAFARALVAAQRRGALPDRLSKAVDNMSEVDPYFQLAEEQYDSGQYPSLFPDYDPYDETSDDKGRPLSPNAVGESYSPFAPQSPALAAQPLTTITAPRNDSQEATEGSATAYQSEAERVLAHLLDEYQHDLPMAVQDVLDYEQDDPDALPQALVAAKQSGQLPDDLSQAVDEMGSVDYRYNDASEEYDKKSSDNEQPESWF